MPIANDDNENIVLNEPSDIGGRMLETWLRDGKIGNPEEQGPYFEGDIVQMPEGRNGVTSPTLLWKNGLIPYEIQGSFSKLSNKLIQIS